MPSDQSTGTKERLLESAAAVFAEKGYGEATIAEICRRADANISAVNYYFRSKEKLYVEAWRNTFEQGVRKYPPDGGVGDDFPPEHRLRARISALIKRILDPGTKEFEIMRHELSNPTGLLLEAHKESIEPLRRRMHDLLKEMLGSRATEGQVGLCMLTVMSPIFYTLHRLKHPGRMMGDKARALDDRLEITNMGPFIEHTMRFVLAGINEMKKGIESGDWPDMEFEDDFVQRLHKRDLE